jgi:uncharacterized protein
MQSILEKACPINKTNKILNYFHLAKAANRPYNLFMSQSSDLFRLQRIDTRRDQAQARVREIEKILSSDATLRQAQDCLDAADKELTADRRLLRDAEDAVEAQRIKIEQTESSLYGGKVHNPKELQDLQNEATSLKKFLLTLEDRQLDAMLALEQAESEHTRCQALVENARAAFGQKQANLLQENETLKKEVAKLDSERLAAASQIPASNLAEYEKLRQQKRGLAVTSVVDESCDGCGATLAPAEWQAARSPQRITFCPSCGRILYAG